MLHDNAPAPHFSLMNIEEPMRDKTNSPLLLRRRILFATSVVMPKAEPKHKVYPANNLVVLPSSSFPGVAGYGLVLLLDCLTSLERNVR